MTKSCIKCHQKLANFIGYLPQQGEVCISCYKDYAIKEEAKTLGKTHNSKHN